MMYVIGGDTSTTSVEVFDGVSWTGVAPVPEKIDYLSVACAIESRIYLFGNDKVYCYDVDEDEWTMVMEVDLDFDHEKMSVNLVGDKIYIKCLKRMVIFDSVNNTFGKVQQDNLTYTCTVLNGNLYGLGLD
jgi:hypothetical protein